MSEALVNINNPDAISCLGTEDVPAGYKRTEIGVIPEDWVVKKIENIAHVTSGKRLPLGNYLVEHPTPYPYIRVTDMRPGTVSLCDIRFVPRSVFPAIRQYRIFRDEIFISVAGTLGIIGRVPTELDGANLTENANRISQITCSVDFLLYSLMSPRIQNTIDSIQTVGAQPKLALGRIRQFLIPLPQKKHEQRAIAEALSDVDKLLESLDALIAKKRAIKQATMQQLLTGMIRLPGFREKWAKTRLDGIGYFLKGSGITRDETRNEGLACIRYGQIYTKYDFHVRRFHSYIEPQIAQNSVRLFTGDLLEVVGQIRTVC